MMCFFSIECSLLSILTTNILRNSRMGANGTESSGKVSSKSRDLLQIF